MIAMQCRAARALLGWSQQDLAGAAGIGVVTVRQFEAGAAIARRATMEALMTCLEKAGVEFLAGNGAGPGVRLRQAGDTLEGFQAFIRQYERHRLLGLARQADPLPQFGYRFDYQGPEAAQLTYRGEPLGGVRWRAGVVCFDPSFPLEAGEIALSERVFDTWVSRAEYRKTTGF